MKKILTCLFLFGLCTSVQAQEVDQENTEHPTLFEALEKLIQEASNESLQESKADLTTDQAKKEKSLVSNTEKVSKEEKKTASKS